MIPDIKGPRLPDYNTLFTENDKELYAQIVLVLFKPFTNISDLLGMYLDCALPWWPAYKAYLPSMCTESNIIINNLQDYHTCRERASSKFANEINSELDHTNMETNENEFFHTN